MTKFLHTADWQLGMKAISLGNAAEIVRGMRLETARKLLDIARDEKVDFVLIAGDLFESNAVSRDIIEQLIEIFEKAPDIQVFIISGNHDPLEPDSIYTQKIWNHVPSNVTVLSESKAVHLEKFNAILFPCPLNQKRSGIDPTAWIPVEETEQIRIGIAHGTLDIGITSEPNFPINPDRVKISGLDYLALGDWHSLLISDDGRTVYPGTPEATSFEERDPGHCVIVKLEKGKLPELTVKNCSKLKWEIWNEDVESLKDVQGVMQKLNRMPDKDKTLITLKITGVVDIEVLSAIDQISDTREFLYLKVDQSELYLKPSSLNSIVEVVPAGNLRRVADSLVAILSREPRYSQNIDKPIDELESLLDMVKQWCSREAIKSNDMNVEVLQKALLLLYQFSKEVAG